jgi:NDP-mannose synthase
VGAANGHNGNGNGNGNGTRFAVNGKANGRAHGGQRAVILAGGRGTRLGPFTTVIPKPLLPIGNRAILDVVVHQMRAHGFTDLTFAVGYLSHLIKAIFSDGADHDVSISYHDEDQPLGTAGALSQIDGLDDTFLVMNGDVLTTLDYTHLLKVHKEAGNLLTIASHRRVVKTDYGVLELGQERGDTTRVDSYVEKPELPYVVSMGVYIAEPEILRFIPESRAYDMPQLVLDLIDAGEPVGSYIYDGYWLDIGRHEDYELATNEHESLMPLLMGTPPVVP